MSEQRLAEPPGRHDEARLLHAAALERLTVAAADLALPERLRLSDWQRSKASSLAGKLIRTVEDELRADLAASEAIRAHQALAAAFASAHVPIAIPMLERVAFSDHALVATLVRRTQEHRRAPIRASGETPFLVGLIADGDPMVAEHAMAVLIGQSRRLDTFDEPAAARTELPAELEHRLVWRVAAALRQYMVEIHGLGAAAADKQVVAAAERLLARYDEGDVLEARAMRLVRRLHETGRLDDAVMERIISEGSLTLFIAAIAVRTSISHASAWEIASEPKGRGLVFLLRAAAIDRGRAAAILLILAASEEAVAAQVDMFDVTDVASARDALRLWRVNPGYREAIAELSS
jgi:hypothetical protein